MRKALLISLRFTVILFLKLSVFCSDGSMIDFSRKRNFDQISTGDSILSDEELIWPEICDAVLEIFGCQKMGQKMTQENGSYEYEGENRPHCVNMDGKQCDSEVIDELDSTIPESIEKFQKQADSTATRKSSTNCGASDLKSVKTIHTELLSKLIKVFREQTGLNVIKIPWVKYNVIGWPENVKRCITHLSRQKCEQVEQALPFIKFKLRKEFVSKTESVNDSGLVSAIDCVDHLVKNSVDEDDDFEVAVEGVEPALDESKVLKDFELNLPTSANSEYYMDSRVYDEFLSEFLEIMEENNSEIIPKSELVNNIITEEFEHQQLQYKQRKEQFIMQIESQTQKFSKKLNSKTKTKTNSKTKTKEMKKDFDSTMMKSMNPEVIRLANLKQRVFDIFKAKTGNDSYEEIYDYEIENWPDYVPLSSNLWDTQALNEIEIALPFLEFQRKPLNWRAAATCSNTQNETFLNRKSLHQDLLDILWNQVGHHVSTFSEDHYQILNWPENVDLAPIRWASGDIIKISRCLNRIQFVPKNPNETVVDPETRQDQTEYFIRDKKTTRRAFMLYARICAKFEAEMKLSRNRMGSYKLDQWPKYVLMNPEIWDNILIAEIENSFESIKFTHINSGYYEKECRKVRRDLMQKISDKTKIRFQSSSFKTWSIFWSKFKAIGWPLGVSKFPKEWDVKAFILLSRAMDSIQFIPIVELDYNIDNDSDEFFKFDEESLEESEDIKLNYE